MKDIILTDIEGSKCKANILFTHYSKEFNKDYIIYQIGKDIYSSTYNFVDNNYVINNEELTNEEYDMIDKIIESKLGGISG